MRINGLHDCLLTGCTSRISDNVLGRTRKAHYIDHGMYKVCRFFTEWHHSMSEFMGKHSHVRCDIVLSPTVRSDAPYNSIPRPIRVRHSGNLEGNLFLLWLTKDDDFNLL